MVEDMKNIFIWQLCRIFCYYSIIKPRKINLLVF